MSYVPAKRKPITGMPDAVAAGVSWDKMCAALHARITARNSAEQQMAQAEYGRMWAWCEANDVDPGGSWGIGRFVLDGDTVKPRRVWERDSPETARQLREMRRG